MRGAEVRAAGLVDLLRAQGHEVVTVHSGKSRPDAVPAGVADIGMEILTGPRKRWAQMSGGRPLRALQPTAAATSEARAALQDFSPDLAIVSEILAWGIAKDLLDRTPWAYDATNVERDLARSHRLHASSLKERISTRVDEGRITRLELRLLRESCAVMTVSPVDQARLRALEPEAYVELVPNSVADQPVAAEPGLADPVMLFVGTLDYGPNVRAVLELIQRVLPAVLRTIPGARLHVVGRNPAPEVVRAVEAAPGARLSPGLPDLAEAYRSARCVVLPIREGSGTNIKLFEALSYGVPVAGTPKSMEGVDVTPGEEVEVAERSDTLAELATELLMDPTRAGELGARGRRAFETRLSWSAAAAQPLRRVLEHGLAVGEGRPSGRSRP